MAPRSARASGPSTRPFLRRFEMLIWPPLAPPPMAAAKKEPEYVDPLPQEFHDSVERFNRDVIERASEIPKDELKRLIAAEHERQLPYLQKESKAMLDYYAALLGLDPKELKGPPMGPGFAKEILGSYVDGDPVDMVRAVRERRP